MKTTLARLARRVVVESGEWPLVGRAYRAVYRLQVARARRALSRVRGVSAVLLRGSSQRDVQPGLSDIDLVIVLDGRLEAEQELAVVARVASEIRSVNIGAPLIRDIHVVTLDELQHWSRLPVYLLGAFHVDTVALHGTVDLPACATDPVLVRDALLRGVAWWTDRGLRQLISEPDDIGRRLATRSLSKASAFADAVRHGERDLLRAMRVYNKGPPGPRADPKAGVEALAVFDEVLHDAPELAAEPRTPHPAIEGLAHSLRRWSEPLFIAGGLDAVVLSVEGACEHDLRMFLVLDPLRPRAALALAQLAEALRRAPALPRDRFTRVAVPLIVSPRQLARSVFLRWTALEPVARLRHGIVLHGSAGTPRASRAEVARSLAYDLMHAASRLRELWRLPHGPREAAQEFDAAHCIVPAARAMAAGEPVVTVDRNPAGAAMLQLSRARRVERFALVRTAARELVPRLLDQGNA